MRLLEYACPECRRPVHFSPLDAGCQCRACRVRLTLTPRFLPTLASKLLFFLGAVLLGCSMSGVLTARGLVELGMERLVVDLVAGVAYFALCRLVFFAFQRPQVVV